MNDLIATIFPFALAALAFVAAGIVHLKGLKNESN